jgi:hypothetical protein
MDVVSGWTVVTRLILALLAAAHADGHGEVDVAELAAAVGVPAAQARAVLVALRDATCVELVDVGAGVVRVARIGPLGLQLPGREPALVPHACPLVPLWEPCR